MMNICFHASAESHTFEASGVHAYGTTFTVLGGYKTKDDNTIEYHFACTYAVRMGKTFYTGTLSDDGATFSGKWGTDEGELTLPFLFKRVPADILVARPPPAEFDENRIRALWKYALDAARDIARKKLFSWSYIKERRDRRKEYLELVQREEDGQTTSEDLVRFAVLDRTSTFDELRCYYVLKDYRQRPVAAHL